MSRRIVVLLAVAAPLLLIQPPRPHDPPAGPRSYVTAGERSDAEGPSSYPSEWEWLRRTWPYGRADENAVAPALARARTMRAAERGHRTNAFPMTLVGPDNIGGRFSDVEWHPTNASVIYAGAANGGVFKSTDAGVTFAPIADDALHPLNIGDLAIDRLNPSTIFVGTGEANGGHNNFAGGGVYRSTDAGASWTFVGLGQSVSIGRIVVDPTNSQRVFVAAQGSYFGPSAERGIYRSTNGGTSWTRVLFVSDTTAATDVVIDPSNPNRMLAAMWERVRMPNRSHLSGPTSGIWRSLDGGSTWSLLGPATGLPNAATQPVGRIGLALCPANPSIAFALINDGANPIGLWRSTNFGTNWADRDADDEIAAGAGGFSWYFGQVRVATNDCNRVYAMDVTFFRSDDGGLTFPVKYGYGNPWLHVDHHALAFHPSNPDAMIQGNDGGLNLSSDRGTSWSKVAGLPVNQFYEIGLDPSDPARLYGGTQDNGTLRTLTGATDDWQNILGGDGFYVSVDPRDGDVIYAESQFGNLFKSYNGGAGWDPAQPPLLASDRLNWSTPVELDPWNPDVVYYGSQRLWRSVDGASSWAPVSGDLTDWVPGARLGTITTIGVSPADSTLLWLGTDDGNVWRGEREGGSYAWYDVTTPTLPQRWVTRVVPHPTDPSSAWVTFNGLKWQESQSHVFATTDGGATWNDLSSNLPEIPVNALTVDPGNAQKLFVGTDLGAYVSNNGGGSWSYLDPALPIVSVYDLAIHPTARYLAIGTHGRSMYTVDLGPVTAVGDPMPVASARLAPSYPNPFGARATIPFHLPRASRVRLVVFDAAGRHVRTLERGDIAAGRQERVWDGRDERGRPVASGTYRVRLELPGGEVHTQGLVRLR